jgi:hypothetical protein
MSTSTLFRHPHLTRGVVHTSEGNFVIQRGLVRVPDAVGAWHGWQRVQPDEPRETRTQAQPILRPAERYGRE